MLLLRVKHSLYQYSDMIGEQRAEEVLRSYFMGREVGEKGKEVEIGKRDAEWLVASMVVYDVPPRHRLNMTTDSELEICG